MKHNLLNHTPGPWIVGEQTNSGLLIEAGRGFNIVVCTVNNGNGTDSLGAEDARLIAAAPEMYHALIAYRRAREDGGISMADYSTIAHNLLMKVLDKVESV